MSAFASPLMAILAAGRASRMGRDKLLLDLEGTPVVRRCAETAVASSPAPILVVVNPENHTRVRQALAGLAVRFVSNERYLDGMGTSIAAAASEALLAEASALVVLQGDQPLVGPGVVDGIVSAWRSGGWRWVGASYAGVLTTPVLFDRTLYDELRALAGDRGARAVLERHRHEGRALDFPEWRSVDLDTEQDYERVQSLWREHEGNA